MKNDSSIASRPGAWCVAALAACVAMVLGCGGGGGDDDNGGGGSTPPTMGEGDRTPTTLTNSTLTITNGDLSGTQLIFDTETAFTAAVLDADPEDGLDFSGGGSYVYTAVDLIRATLDLTFTGNITLNDGTSIAVADLDEDPSGVFVLTFDVVNDPNTLTGTATDDEGETFTFSLAGTFEDDLTPPDGGDDPDVPTDDSELAPATLDGRAITIGGSVSETYVFNGNTVTVVGRGVDGTFTYAVLASGFEADIDITYTDDVDGNQVPFTEQIELTFNDAFGGTFNSSGSFTDVDGTVVNIFPGGGGGTFTLD